VLTYRAQGGTTAVVVALALTGAASAAPTANDILRRALDLSAEVQDYTAQVQVVTDLGGAPEGIPPFTVYFKRPDKVSIKSRSLVVVPRDALTFGNLAKRIEAGAEITLIGTKTVNGAPLYTLKVRPKEAAEERLLVTVEGRRFTVERMEVVRGQTTHATFVWQHTLVQGRYWMPSTIACTVPQAAARGGGPGGRLTVTFSGYRVNTGLSDAVFQAPQ